MTRLPLSRARLTIDGERVAPHELSALVTRTAAHLRAAGVGQGRPFALTGDHPLATVVSALAAERLGAPLLFAGSRPPRRIAVAATVHATRTGQPLVTASAGRPVELPAEAGAVFWTSGSSGDPKAVVLSRPALRFQGSATAARLAVTDEDRLLLPLPLSHAYGFSVLRVWRHTGAHLYVESAFRPARVLELTARAGITSLDGVPAMYRVLLAAAARDASVARALRGLRIRGCGGDVLGPALNDEFLSVVGAPLHDGYGLSEAGPNVALNAPGLLRPATVGRLLDGVRARISPESREIQLLSPSQMLGYLDAEGCPDTGISRAAFTEDGWLRTGDSGTLADDGWLSVTGRLKEILVVNGETVAPAVVEDAVRTASGVLDAAVVGVRRGDRGDTICAFAESAQPDAAATRRRVAETCRNLLPPHMRPRTVRIMAELPRTGAGKPDRVRLRALAAEGVAS
ncbi:fatty acid--CoA ligase family protein [Streptomyces sp. NBC_00237]|uniref:class I adenylate-forming enzyme family protein n=1 Tax=Streptomyces sp. NBC_00237 TaxID=2975687 RepID=UPI002250AF14|nr:fatty acid--CoA ligase family protein [Streptomyces sp. NBC_00237]MCX5205053.1 fatty acid--CoA ligase family protein [Streptomyces sp. NBC_00237]